MGIGNTPMGSGAIGAVGSLDSIIPLGIVSVPPPVPGATNRYISMAPRFNLIGMASLGGGMLWPAVPTGGIALEPDPSTGRVHGWTWWPDAAAFEVYRQTADGKFSAVRGAFPVVPTSATRRNYCTNPSIEAGLNGYVAGTGTPTLAQITRTDIPAPNFALQATVASAGTDEITIPQSWVLSSTMTAALDLNLSATPTGSVTLTISFADASGAAVGTTSAVTIPVADVLAAVGAWHRCKKLIFPAPPPTAATVTTVKLATAGMPAGGSMSIDRVMFVSGSTDAAYGDGDMLGGSWAGTAELSISVVAPVVEFWDGECPLDTWVTYFVSNPGLLGGQAQTNPIQLESLGGSACWVTHPADPANPRRIIMKDSDVAKTRPANVGVYRPLGRPDPVVLSDATRQGKTQTITWGVFSYAERDDWDNNMLDDLQPLLFRMPAAYGFGGGQWWSLGDTTEDPMSLAPQQDMRVFSAVATTVDAPYIVGA